MSEDPPVLELDGLEKHFERQTNLMDVLLRRKQGKIQAVDGVSMRLREKDVIGVIGESGCGKSTLLKTLMGLYDPTGGAIRYNGEDVTEFDRKRWKQYRKNVQIIFQDPFNSLDPKMTVEETLREPLYIHDIGDRERRAREVLEQVQLNPPERYLSRLPHQLSGGEKQRVSIARALIIEPDIILADEPVSMLDVSTQASILRMLSRLTNEYGVSMVYVSHDISTVSYICKRINVMYLGRVVEEARTETVLEEPKHPYTQALINAIPIPDPHHHRERTNLKSTPEDPIDLGTGCRFRDRCPERMEVCEMTPAYIEHEDDHNVACHLYYDHSEYEAGTEGSVSVDGTTVGDGDTPAVGGESQ